MAKIEKRSENENGEVTFTHSCDDPFFWDNLLDQTLNFTVKIRGSRDKTHRFNLGFKTYCLYIS